ncbi:hypothetical protein ABNQ38_34585 (plasmid) [Azospirillum sp. A29]
MPSQVHDVAGMILQQVTLHLLCGGLRDFRPHLDEARNHEGRDAAGQESRQVPRVEAGTGNDHRLDLLAEDVVLPPDDGAVLSGRIREDGRVLRDMYLFEVKTPADSKGKWDYYKQLGVIAAAADAARRAARYALAPERERSRASIKRAGTRAMPAPSRHAVRRQAPAPS